MSKTALITCITGFVGQTFACFDLGWREYFLRDDLLMRPNEIEWPQGCSDKAQRILGWQSTKKMSNVVKILYGV